MTTSGELRSGKGHRDENFPVASRLIHPRHRGIILAFYEFVRVADDIVDHPALSAHDKLDRVDSLEDTLLGTNDINPEGVRLRHALDERGLAPRHAQDILAAFRMDVTMLRYETWDELIHYCSYSAMPVGRFVLDVHGESDETWPANDALCAALQIINHLQDCASDYFNLDRVYVPQDYLDHYGASVAALGEAKASPELLRSLHELAAGVSVLLREAEPLADQVADLRLALEIGVIHRLAVKLTGILSRRDPLSQHVHLGMASVAATSLAGIVAGLFQRTARRVRAKRPRAQGA